MAGRVATPPRAREVSAPISVADPQVDRALSALRATVERLEMTRQRAVVDVDLVVGPNKVRHGLGRPVRGYTITPTAGGASFAHRIDRENPRPETEVWIVVEGVAQPGATVEVW